jgi:uncharacterized membrane protein YdjX (TVP38/TMEM64 family)
MSAAPKKLLLLILGLAVVVAMPFVIWGDAFEAALTGDAPAEFLRRHREWAWLAVIGALASDVLLPIPATPLMAALGMAYGPVLGGLIGGVGSMLGGWIAYALCLRLGRAAVGRWIGVEELKLADALFLRHGGWAVAGSRWLPVLPEALACLAGIARMPAWSFLLSLACGSLPMAFAFALLGHLGRGSSAITLLVSAALPLALWPLVRLGQKRFLSRGQAERGPAASR